MQSLVSTTVCLNFYLVELFFRAFTKTLKTRYFYSQTQNIHVTHLASFCDVCLGAEQRIYLQEAVQCLVLGKSSIGKLPEALACGVFSTHLLNDYFFFQFTQKCVLICSFLYSTISFWWRMGICLGWLSGFCCCYFFTDAFSSPVLN